MIDDKATVDRQVEEIISMTKDNHPKTTNVQLIKKAYELADKAHGNQRRRSGERYIIHPVQVAYILAEYKMDWETITAALLHDVIEDTEYTFEDIEREFSHEIAEMVESVSKMTRMDFQTKEESQNEYFRKMIISMSKDLRIIIIKLADRLHNMRTLSFMPENKKIEKSKETLEIYAPIANRLGIQGMKSELEDLAFKYLEPKEYSDINRQINLKRQERQEYIDKVVDMIQKKLKENGIEAKVYGRSKHLYSIYKKLLAMNKKGGNIDEIYDLYAVRIITENNVQDVYAALGIVHTMWKAVPGRMKDYITSPKLNGYQSLHTTVVGPQGKPVEVQIRTQKMHENDEFGIAAHWKYKEGKGLTRKLKDVQFEQDISWLRQWVEAEFENATDFMDSLKIDLQSDEVYVLSPKGEFYELPKGSTPVDFAYRVHTDVGNTCVGAKVNGNIVPLNYQLQTGDRVQILTNKRHGPSYEWTSFVKTSHARTKIRQYFKQVDREENAVRGRNLLEAEVKRLSTGPNKLMTHPNLAKLAQAMNYKSETDFLVSIGVGSLRLGGVMKKLQIIFPEAFPKEPEPEPILSAPHSGGDEAVIVAGQTGIDTHFAKCCNPIPGDKIVGYITMGNGVSIHRMDCPNVTHVKDPDRLLEAQWNLGSEGKGQGYSVELYIEAVSKMGTLKEILQPFYDFGVPLVAVNTKTDDSTDYFNILCEVKNKRVLTRVMTQIQNMPETLVVSRK